MVFLLKDFIDVERVGDWDLHLRTVELMIAFFHAARHFPYAKYSEIYLQKLMKSMKIEDGPFRRGASSNHHLKKMKYPKRKI